MFEGIDERWTSEGKFRFERFGGVKKASLLLEGGQTSDGRIQLRNLLFSEMEPVSQQATQWRQHWARESGGLLRFKKTIKGRNTKYLIPQT